MSQTFKRDLCPKCKGVGYVFDVDSRIANDAASDIGKCRNCKGYGRTLVPTTPRKSPSAYRRLVSMLFRGR